MPIYEYECTSCGKRVEVIQSFSDPPLTECSECEGGTLRKLLSAPAFQFKGSGWYVTDYADRGKSKDGKSQEGESSAETKKPAGDKAPAASSAKDKGGSGDGASGSSPSSSSSAAGSSSKGSTTSSD